MWFTNLWRLYNDVAHRVVIGSDPKAKNILRPGSCGGSYFQQACQEYDRLVTYSSPPGDAPAPPDNQTPVPLSCPAAPAYRSHVGALRDQLVQKYAADSLTWDDLYGFQIALLPLYPPDELRTKRASLKDAFYKSAPQHSIESYERTQPPPLAGDTQYNAALADAVFIQTELSKMETYRPHQEFKRNRITLDLFISLAVTLLFYLLVGCIAVVILCFSHGHSQSALPRAFPCIVIAMMLGALGAVVSSQRRLQASFDEDSSILNTTRYVGSGLGTRLTPILGSIFAGVLIVLIYSGLFSTAAGLVVPESGQPPNTSQSKNVNATQDSNDAKQASSRPIPSQTAKTDSAGKDDREGGGNKSRPEQSGEGDASFSLLSFLISGPSGSHRLVEYAKILVYAFLAGFAERLVPDTLDRLSMNSKR
jgi:hypothetical protein